MCHARNDSHSAQCSPNEDDRHNSSPEEFLVPCFLQGQNTVTIFFLYIQELIDTRTVGEKMS